MWITSKEQIQSATTDDLRRALLTCDGSGTAIKEACLTALIERENAKLREQIAAAARIKLPPNAPGMR